MKNKKIIFRANGNAIIGLGHLYRLLAIAEMVIDKFQVEFIIDKHTLCAILPDKFSVNVIPEYVDENKWISSNYSPEDVIIAIDGYQFDASYQKSLKRVGYFVVYIDDLVKEHQYADVVINHSLTVSKEDYVAESYTRFALGTKFAMLRPSFLEKASQIRAIEKCDTCFVCFGGSDMFNLSEKAVLALRKIAMIKEVHVVLGGANSNDGIYKIQSDTLNINVYQNIEEKQLCQIMEKCNIAIVSSSTISYEVCSVKMPILGGYYVENQREIYKGLVQNGVIFGGGDFEKYTENDFKDKIQKLLLENNKEQYLKNQARLFDGGIKNRIVDIFVNLDSLQIRKVERKDVDTLFRWSNDKQVRSQSFSSQQISYKEHCEWFEKKINDENAILLIIEIGQVPAGIVRFDKGSETSTIGISIDEKFRGKGFGNRFLKLALKTYFSNENKSVLAFVKKENIASIRSFEKAGFRFFRNEKVNGIKSLVFIFDEKINE